MKIPKYWARSAEVELKLGRQTVPVACWQWSDSSIEQARQLADDRAKELAQKALSGAPLNRYGYDERPLREEITHSMKGPAGNEIGLVTRNLYGARVLNAANAMFIDIDFSEKDASASLGGQLKRLFGQRPVDPTDKYLEQVATWASQRPELGLRVYRTYGGLRCLITNEVFDPRAAESLEMLRALGSDPLYVRLCQAQECFRARLTPKPWRCGLPTPPSRYPWEDAAAEARYRQWEQRYEAKIAPYAVCKFIHQFGPDETHPDVEPVLTLHDKLTCPEAECPLA